MITMIVSLYDKKTRVFKNPFYALRLEAATRALHQAVNNKAKDNEVAAYPHDFALYCLGSFNDEFGTFDLYPAPKLVAEAAQFVTPEGITDPTNEERK